MVIDDTVSVEGIFKDLDRCHACLTDSLTTLKDRATQLLIKYKSGALVTQYQVLPILAPSRKAKHKGKCPNHTPEETDPKNWKGYKPEFYSSVVWSSTIEQGAYKPYEGAYVHFCFSNSIWRRRFAKKFTGPKISG